MTSEKWNLIIDIDRCNNCNNCWLAVKDEHVGNDFAGYAAPQPLHGHHWLEMKRAEHGSAPIVDIVNVPTMCNHCDDAPCVRAGGGAVTKRDDGIVIIDPKAAKGRRDLVSACPYGAVWWNEELQLPQHWIFDAHLLDQGWETPRCAQACPTEAMRAVKVTDADMRRIVEQDDLEVMRPELGTRPRVYYRALHRYDRWMLAGSVSAQCEGRDECVAGAEVELRSEAGLLASTVTDAFGEYRLRRLPARPVDCTLEIRHPAHATHRQAIALTGSTTLAHVVLESS
jgi:Fe-S-cluster-containing dehydrogenase component